MPLARRRAAAAASILLALPALALAGPLFDAVPGDAFAAVWVKDATELKAKFQNAPLGKAYMAPEMDRAREILKREFDKVAKRFEDETKVKPEDLFGVVSGEAVVFATTFQSSDEGSRRQIDSDVVFATAVKEGERDKVDQMVRSFLEKAPADARKRTYEVGGTTVYSVEYTEESEAPGPFNAETGEQGPPVKVQTPVTLQYAYPDGAFAFAYGVNEPLKAFLPALAGGDAKRLKSTETFARALSELGGEHHDVNFFFDYNAIIDAAQKNSDGRGGSSERTQQTLRGLGITGSGPVMLGSNLTETSTIVRLAIAMQPDKPGIWRILYGNPANPLARLKEVPAEAVSVTNWTLEGEPLMKNLRALLQVVSPQQGFAGLNFALATAQKELGVNLETAILNNLSGEHLYYRLPMTREQLSSLDAAADSPESALAVVNRTVVSIGYRDGENVTKTINKVIEDQLAKPEAPLPIEKSTEQGFTVYRGKDDPSNNLPLRPAIALTPAAAFVTFDDSVLQGVLRRASGKAGESILDSASLKGRLAAVKKEDLRLLAVSTEEATIESYQMEFGSLKSRAANSSDPSLKELIEALPPPSFLKGRIGATVSTVYLRNGSILIEGETALDK